MLHLLLAFLLIIASVSVSPALGKDWSYRDSRQPSFTLLVPDGWTATTTKEGVNLAYNTAWGMLWVVPKPMQPGAMLVSLRRQMEQQTKNFQELDSGSSRFGGQKSSYFIFSGISPNGNSHIQKVMTMTNGQLTYTLFMGAHPDEYDRLKRDMNRIEASFSPDPAR